MGIRNFNTSVGKNKMQYCDVVIQFQSQLINNYLNRIIREYDLSATQHLHHLAMSLLSY
jgi:hypothetical protein